MAPSATRDVEIIDIRRDKHEESLSQIMIRSLSPRNGSAKSMPTLLLYDEQGLKLFEEITYLDEYYLTNAEINALETNSVKIVAQFPDGARLVELGSGNLRKIDILFKAFEKAKKNVEYFALDLSLSELRRTFSKLSIEDYNYVSFHGLHGTYEDGFAWLSNADNKSKPTCVLSLGSSIGNFSRAEAAEFLAAIADVLGPASTIIVGLDACQNPDRVFSAYNDSEGVTERFYRNGLDHANTILGYLAFKQDEWAVRGNYDEKENKHEAFYEALRDVRIGKISISQGERLKVEEAFKYSESESDVLWHAAGLISQHTYSNHDGSHNVYLLSPSKIKFSVKPAQYATYPVPSLQDWRQLWNTWDTVTRSMVPRDEIMNKPIKLRNNLIFYLGHIPTFADIHVQRATGLKATDPTYYQSIFERGIDPDVDNPEICHDHSEIPDNWPPMDEIIRYQFAVRERVEALIQSGEAQKSRKLGRSLWLSFEHEAMHLETFLYMLLQSERVLPPPGVRKPDFRAMALEAKHKRVPNAWQTVPEGKVRLGLDDPENDDGPDRYFGWDNERPSRNVTVGAFQTQTRPISNGEYARFLETTHRNDMPVSWTTSSSNGEYSNGVNRAATNGYANGIINGDPGNVASKAFIKDKAIRTVFGLVPLEYALDWPVMASYEDLFAFAKWCNSRIPTLEEARKIYNYVEAEKAKAQNYPSKLISAVNGHLCNEGVQETPPAYHLSHSSGADVTTTEVNGDGNQRLNPNSLFVDLTGSNVGFANWHPTPVTHLSNLCGQSEIGGLWEWTSTPLAPFPGFKSMDLYPGYTSDFFDGKHNICLGGSWATIPRIAGRKTFINWYQKNYPYVWCTARLVRDI